MNTIFFPFGSASMMDHTGWSQEFVKPKAEDVNNKGGMEARAQPFSPCDQQKRRRLSCLLDRLNVQIRNNNQYKVKARWLPCVRPTKPQEDAPLDLSMKSPLQIPRPLYTCSQCGETFSVHDRLAKHFASRHGRRTPDSQRNFQCDICERRFTRSDMLTRHSRLHSGERPYACPDCGQVFSRSDHLVTHQRTHSGEKPYSCPLCAYTACRRDMITRHMKTHAKKEK